MAPPLQQHLEARLAVACVKARGELLGLSLRPGQQVALSEEELGRRIHGAQEELARAAGRFPDGGDVLDVGCGLGGGSLYWAMEHSARVTAVTIAPSHVGQVLRFAEAAGGERQGSCRVSGFS